jgi:hypothetical protein
VKKSGVMQNDFAAQVKHSFAANAHAVTHEFAK